MPKSLFLFQVHKEADMAKMAADPKTQEWWEVCGPMQVPHPDRAEGEWWKTLKEVFHCD